MSISLPDARHLSGECLEALRVRALHGIECGFSETVVAEILGVARETVSRWWTAYVSGGLTGLPQYHRAQHPGFCCLAGEQATIIRSLIDSNTPEKLGIASTLWTRHAIGDLIRRQFNIDLADRTVGEYLRRWGYTPQKPQRHAHKQDPKEVVQWLYLTYPAIEKKAAAEDAEIHWCDEVGVAADHQPGTSYSPKGQPATMDVPPPHIHMNQISTVTNEGTVRFMTYKGTMNDKLFLTFLGRLLKATTKKILLITDRLKAHDDDMVHNWEEAHKDRIELF